MGEHDHMSVDELQGLVQQRLAEGKPVGRLIDSLQGRGESTTHYQSQRTMSDVSAHVRWKSYQGKAASEEARELERRASGETKEKAIGETKANPWWKFW